MKPTTLRFFNELGETDLERTFTSTTLGHLATLGAGVTMGLLDRSPARAALIRRLADAKIPVGAWLLLPERDGYFATHDNSEHIEALLEDTLRWARDERLPFEAIGFDFEPALHELRAFMANPVPMATRWAWRARDITRYTTALAAYTRLLAHVRVAGFRADTFQFPLIKADRDARGSLWQRIAGGLDLAADREVMMAYSSLLGVAGPGIVERIAPTCGAIGLGSTGGGVDPFPKLAWPAFERDLLLASAHCNDVSVFSLEGCVAQGFLERLVDFDWSRTVTASSGARFATQLLTAVCTGLSRI